MTRHTLLAHYTLLAAGLAAACTPVPDQVPTSADQSRVADEVRAAVWAFHAADTARDAEAVIGLLWPDYSMLVDGARLGYDQVVAGSRDFLTSIALFHTQWSDLQVTPLSQDAAVASFQFRDSIITKAGQLIRHRGTTTFVWQRRDGEWRLLFADADHHPVAP